MIFWIREFLPMVEILQRAKYKKKKNKKNGSRTRKKYEFSEDFNH